MNTFDTGGKKCNSMIIQNCIFSTLDIEINEINNRG
eukprot:CAMPEP_0197303582 /NCGR_PEP_ID=MMETSP0890-20130614/51749_1 /TAXON_ID=44058 ORGANISM="Aureoumbra lagunensis, Strain CCMP1510" /NCGR_SAMPLE_ID=MMETSP0890 /ASSEMBLY_ACC=CAM_ASM_000533 /LENGTH=35 /DNA_ID= /DNA_START= /DNA_END= /DNA_ORIENTATION=